MAVSLMHFAFNLQLHFFCLSQCATYIFNLLLSEKSSSHEHAQRDGEYQHER